MDDAITASGIFNEFDPDDPEFSLTVASEILDLRAENARLTDQLQAVSDQLTEAVQRAQEAEARASEFQAFASLWMYSKR